MGEEFCGTTLGDKFGPNFVFMPLANKWVLTFEIIAGELLISFGGATFHQI
jgi:hypothetical protein